MNFNTSFAFGLAWVAFWVGIGVKAIGEIPHSTEPYPWYLPLSLLVLTGLPFVLGLLAGKED